MKNTKVAITLGIMCCILTFGIMIQLNTTKSVVSTAGQSLKENELRDEVLKWKENYDRTYEELERTTKLLEEERQKSTSNDETSLQKQEQLKQINKALGLTDVTGEGVVVTVYDNKNGLGGAADLIHDGDLREVVNELKNAGAEAISINDERIVSSTAITCVGTVIQVNKEKVSSPFVIKAIGNQTALWGGITRPGGYLERLQ